ncbi:MAG TPA: endonuclease/exonuclease/phosphatase family protein [Chroococcales cyanobacterium]|jgi:endonuclease/exonuclease/phosphatase family metal-dependent hydrolase
MIVSLEEAPLVPSGELRAMTYNVFDGPRDPEGVSSAIAAHQPDILALQEVSEEGTRRLAAELGYRGVFFGQAKDLRHGFRFVNGKAILSRYPLSYSEHSLFVLDPEERAQACERRGDWGELNEDRGILLAEVVIGDRPVEILCVHLALGDARINAENLRQLHRFALGLRNQGHEILIMGDFNAHLGIKSEGDLGRYLSDYAKSPGNIAQKEVLDEAGRLLDNFPSVWETTPRREVLFSDGRVLTPEEAKESLLSRSSGAEDWLEMKNAADGNTHPNANKRFDNILTTLRAEKVTLDHSRRPSDHFPVLAHLTFRRHSPLPEK